MADRDWTEKAEVCQRVKVRFVTISVPYSLMITGKYDGQSAHAQWGEVCHTCCINQRSKEAPVISAERRSYSIRDIWRNLHLHIRALQVGSGRRGRSAATDKLPSRAIAAGQQPSRVLKTSQGRARLVRFVLRSSSAIQRANLAVSATSASSVSSCPLKSHRNNGARYVFALSRSMLHASHSAAHERASNLWSRGVSSRLSVAGNGGRIGLPASYSKQCCSAGGAGFLENGHITCL